MIVSAAQASELGRGDFLTKLYYHHPPDPVNIRTLNFFFPVDDHLVLPCVMPIEIKIAYNSYSGDASIFGEKWTFNHNIRVKKGNGQLEIIEGDGFSNVYIKERNLEENKKAQIEELLIAQRKADSMAGGLKSPSVYDDLRRRLQTDETLREEMSRKFLAGAKPLLPGIYYSFARGPSTLEFKADGSFVRKFSNSAFEVFDKEGRLVRTEDRNGNYLTYVYQQNNLSRINDMCGRYVLFFYQTNPVLKNFVSKISDTLNREITYQITPNKRLKSFAEAGGRKIEFEYDKVGNITKLTNSREGRPPDTIMLTYNDKFEISSQAGPGSKESRFKRTFVANNPNHSITEVTKFEGGKPNGKEVHEFKMKEFETVTKFDAAGKETSRETKSISKITGYPTSVLDERGNGEKYEYDAKSGNLIRREQIPSGEVMEFEYDEACNSVKRIHITRPTGQKIENRYKFDARCNLQEAEEYQGTVRKIHITAEFQKNGKLAFLRDKTQGRELAFTYWQYGKPDSITLKDVGTLKVKYSPAGEIQNPVETFPHGKGAARFKGMSKEQMQASILAEVRAGLDEMLNFLRPAGLNIGL